MSSIQKSITAFPNETPSSWKGSFLASESLFPTSLYLTNCLLYDILYATNLEFRERRLVVNVQPTVAPIAALSNAQQQCFGSRVGSYYDALTTQTIFGSLGRKYNMGIRITCQGYAQSTLQCDARQGTYRIPPSTAIRVQAVLSKVNSELGSYTPVNIRCELADSCDGPVIRPTETASIAFPTATACGVYLNPLARWIDFNASADDIGTATAPILTAYPYNAALPAVSALGPSLQRNYVTLTWFPNGDPIDIGGGVSVFNDDGRPVYRLAQSGTGTAYTQFCQYLEW